MLEFNHLQIMTLERHTGLHLALAVLLLEETGNFRQYKMIQEDVP
jgi:hypothetical protein